MSVRLIQAAFPIFAFVLLAGLPARAETVTTNQGTVSIPGDVSREVTADDLSSFIDKYTPSLFNPSEPDPTPKPVPSATPAPQKTEDKTPDAEKKTEKEKGDTAPDKSSEPAAPTWQAKRGYVPPEKAAAPAYKVYRAPGVQEAAPPSSMDYGVFLDTAPQPPRAADVATGATAAREPSLKEVMAVVDPNPPVPTEKLPPPALSPEMPKVAEKPPANSAAATASVSRVTDVPRPRASVPENATPRGDAAGAVPSQFFPVFPANVLPDTQPLMLPVASNDPLVEDHTHVTNAILFLHDMKRNVSETLAMLTTINGQDEGRTFILMPQFPLEVDVARFASYLPEEGRTVARWPLGTNAQGRAEGWNVGGDSFTGAGARSGVSSFTAVDLLLLFLADKARFPHLKTITIAGHGMGGDFVQRYAAFGQAYDVLTRQGITVRHIVANASSYLYFTAGRPSSASSGFAAPQAKVCADYDRYPYGLNDLVPYGRLAGGNAVRLRYAERPVIYILGDKIVQDPYGDPSCPAKLQGASRLERGQNYQRYLTASFGEQAERNHRFIGLHGAGLDPVAIFGSPCGASLLFNTRQDACKVGGGR